MDAILPLSVLVVAGCAIAYAFDRISGYRAGGAIGIVVIALVALRVMVRL